MKLFLTILFGFSMISCQLQIPEFTLSIKSDLTIDFEDNKNLSLLNFSTLFPIFIQTQMENHKSIIIDLRVEDTTPIRFTKDVKRVLREYHNYIAVKYSGDNGNYILVRLPPYSPDSPDISKLKKRNRLLVLVKNDNSISVNGQVVTNLKLEKLVEKFLVSDPDNENLPKLTLMNLPKIGEIYCARHSIIQIEHEYLVQYEPYLKAYSTIKNVYDELYDTYSLKYFNSPYKNLSDENTEVIKTILPFVLSETD